MQRVVTEAISSNTGSSMYLRGPASSGKATLADQLPRAVREWCNQHAKPVPMVSIIFNFDIDHSAGLYGEILKQLRHEASEVAAEAKKQLEAVVFNSSDVRMIMVRLDGMDSMAASHTEQLQQLYEWAYTAGSRLILLGTGIYDVTQILLGLQQADIVPVQVVCNPFTDNDVVTILSARVGSIVQPAALELCAKHASGSVARAIKLCCFAVLYADNDITNSSKEVTLDHMEQTVRFYSSCGGPRVDFMERHFD
jgi:Cdc6-like AAA superfamily ATPase